MTADPALRFWLEWAETKGAACESRGDTTLVLLPEDLQRALMLPAEFDATTDPEAAREDGALFLSAGHPAIEAAASDVLQAGDVGQIVLAPSPAASPDPGELLARARDRFPVDHGRLQLVARAVPTLHPVLRVDALVTHRVSLHDRFQERAEVWVDAETGCELPARLRDRLARAVPAPGAAAHPLPRGLREALASAGLALSARAEERQVALAADQRATLEAELVRTRAYYEALLDNLAKRAANAPADRQAGYAARAEATRAERARRLAEVEEKFRPTSEVRPFRLHLVWVPGYRLAIEVERGVHRHALPLVWLGPAGDFVPRRCPSCGAAALLVATKARLGCRSCQPVAPLRPGPSPEPAAAEPAAAEPAPKPRPTSRAEPARKPPASVSPRPAEPPARDPHAVARTGERLALDFWRAAAVGDRTVRRFVAPDSPLAALRTLYGAAAAALAIGSPPGEPFLSATAATMHAGAGGGKVNITAGTVSTPRERWRYAIRWDYVDGRPAVHELLPVAWWSDASLPPHYAFGSWIWPRLVDPPAQPRIDLDPVAARLWEATLPQRGLPLAARCLAAWWGLAGDHPDGPPDLLAAAVRYEVSRLARLGETYAVVAEHHQVSEAGLRQLVTALRPRLASLSR
ncbi:MAG: hypothetical protein ACYDAQ_13075 [Mycobacteriales bacterium]